MGPVGRRIRRYVLTGAPGAGKTVLIETLRRQGQAVVAEAATDVIAREQSRGVDEPWERPDFVDRVVRLQRERLEAPLPVGHDVQFHDRSPLCTLALARFLRRPVTAALGTEVDRVLREHLFAPTAFLVRPLGTIETTAARRISYAAALEFGDLHAEVYREHGFDLAEVPVAGPAARAAFVVARAQDDTAMGGSLVGES